MPRRFLARCSGLIQRSSGRCHIIAVAGVSPAVGTTHALIMMANFLRRQRLKVGVVELGKKRHFEQIEKAYEGMGFDPLSTDAFKVKQVTYHKQVTRQKLVQLYRSDYDVLILDIGHELTPYAEDFQLADLSLVTAQLNDWKQEEISTFVIAWDQILDKRTRWVLPFADDGEIREFGKMHGQRGYGIGFCHDPFVRDKVVDSQFQKLFS